MIRPSFDFADANVTFINQNPYKQRWHKCASIRKDKKDIWETLEAVQEDQEALLEVADSIAALEKCIKQPVQSADKNVKFHSSLQMAGQFSVKIASQRRKSTKNLFFECRVD